LLTLNKAGQQKKARKRKPKAVGRLTGLSGRPESCKLQAANSKLQETSSNSQQVAAVAPASCHERITRRPSAAGRLARLELS